jgi:hypothetical protein
MTLSGTVHVAYCGKIIVNKKLENVLAINWLLSDMRIFSIFMEVAERAKKEKTIVPV